MDDSEPVAGRVVLTFPRPRVAVLPARSVLVDDVDDHGQRLEGVIDLVMRPAGGLLYVELTTAVCSTCGRAVAAGCKSYTDEHGDLVTEVMRYAVAEVRVEPRQP